MFGKKGERKGEFDSPVAVDVDADGNIYIADYYNNRVQMLSRDGTFVRAIGKGKGSGNGRMGHPYVLQLMVRDMCL